MDYPITKQEYNQIRTLLYKESRISLGENKQSLVVSRLSKHLRELEIDTFDTYYEIVTRDISGGEFTRMLDLLSTNKTDLFRAPMHCDYLKGRIRR